MSVETEIRLRVEGMKQDADRAEDILRDLKARLERDEIKLNITFSERETQERLDRLLTDLQKRVDANPIVIPTELGTPSGGIGAAGAMAGAGGVGGGGFSFGNDALTAAGVGRLMRGGGAMIGVAVAARGLEGAMNEWAKQAEEGSHDTEKIVREFFRAFPLVGSAIGIGEAWQRIDQAQKLRALGLPTPEEANRPDPATIAAKESIQQRERMTDFMDRIAQQQGREAELTGLSGYDLQRARARQHARVGSELVGGLVNVADKFDSAADRTAMNERIIDLQKLFADDLEKKLRSIDERQGAEELGKAVREWYADLRDSIRAKARQAREDERIMEDAQKDAVKEGELHARHDRDDRRRERDASDLNAKAREQELRNQGNGRMADFIGLRQRVWDRITDAGSDPNKKLAAVRLGAAELEGFRSERAGGGRYSSSIDFSNMVQDAILKGGGGGQQKANELAKDMLGELKNISKDIKNGTVGVVKR